MKTVDKIQSLTDARPAMYKITTSNTTKLGWVILKFMLNILETNFNYEELTSNLLTDEKNIKSKMFNLFMNQIYNKKIQT